MVAPVLKGGSFGPSRGHYLFTSFTVIQITISQAIVGYRTWNIARRSRDMGIFLFIFGLAITIVEWYANIDSRVPIQKDGK